METNSTAVTPTKTRPSATEIENLRHLVTSLLPSWQHNYALHQRFTQTWPILSTTTPPLPHGALLPKQLQSHTSTTTTNASQSISSRTKTEQQQPWRRPHRIFASAIPLSDGRLPLSAALQYYTGNENLNSDDDYNDDDNNKKNSVGVTLDTLTYLAGVPHRPPCGLCTACTSKNNKVGLHAYRHCKALQALRAWEGVLGDVSTSTVVEMCTHAMSRLGKKNNNNKKKKKSQLLFRGLYCKHCPACRRNFNRPNKTYKCWLAIAIEENSLPSRLTGGGAAGVLEEIRPHLPSQPHRHRDEDVVDGDDNDGDEEGYVVDPFESYVSITDHIDDDDYDEESLRRWLPWLLWKYKSNNSSNAAIAFDDDDDGDDDDGASASAAAGKKRKAKKQDAGRKKAKVTHGPSNKRAVREKAAQLAQLFQVPIDEITIWTCWKPKQQEDGRQSTSTSTTTSSACGHTNGENLYQCEVCGGNRWDGPIGQLATRVAAIISSSRYNNKNGSNSSNSSSRKQLPLPSAEQIAARMQWEANTTVDNNIGGVFPVYYGDPLSGLGRGTLVEAIDILLHSRQFQYNNNNNNDDDDDDDDGVVVASPDEDDDASLPFGTLKIMPRTLLGRSVVRLESTAAMMVEDLQALHNISSSVVDDDDNRRVAVISGADRAEQSQRQEDEQEVMVNSQEPRAENIQPSSTLSYFVSQCVGLFQQLGMHQALQEEELSSIIQSLILVHHQLKPNLDVCTFIACLKVLLTDNKRKRGIESNNVATAATDGLALHGLSTHTVASALAAIHNSQLEDHPRQGELPSMMTWTEWKQDNCHHRQHHLKTPSDNNNNDDDDADFLTAARSIQTLETFLWNLLSTILKETSSSPLSSHTQLYVGKQKGGGKVKKRPNASGPDEIEHPPFLGLPPYPVTVTITGLIGGWGGGRGSTMGMGGHTLLHAPMAVEEPLRSLKMRRRREEEGRGGGSTSEQQERAIALEEKLKDLPNDVCIVFNAAASLGVREDILEEALGRWKYLTQ